jgi:dihydroorotase
MTIYITDTTTVEDIISAKNSGICYVVRSLHWCMTNASKGIVYGAKLYPAGATTNSELGVTSIEKIHPILRVIN